MYQKSFVLHKKLIISSYIDYIQFCFPFFCIDWLMGYDILPADPARYADYLRPDTVGFQPPAEMGRRMGEVANKVSDGAFLWSDVVLRGIISLCNSLIISVVILQNTST